MPAQSKEKSGRTRLLRGKDLPMTADAILKDFSHYFGRMLGRRTVRPDSPFSRWSSRTAAVFRIYRSSF
jgi:hypothetical protein